MLASKSEVKDPGASPESSELGAQGRAWAIPGLHHFPGANCAVPKVASIQAHQQTELMKRTSKFIAVAMVTGVIVVIPIYLALLLFLKAIKSALFLVKPFALFLPEGIPAEHFLALLLVLFLCFLVGVLVRTPLGRAIRERIEKTLFERVPGYALLRSLTQRVMGENRENAWKPALAEIENALVPAFIVEECDDGRLTVFVPSIPTPLAGAVYILSRERVHPLDVPFTKAVQSISRWGSGSKDLVAAMKTTNLR
jgi:uncharacterized membrane protein